MQVAEKAAPGSVILCMLPDTGERYLSTPLFEGIADGDDRGRNRASALDAEPPDGPGVASLGAGDRDREAVRVDAREVAATQGSVFGSTLSVPPRALIRVADLLRLSCGLSGS